MTPTTTTTMTAFACSWCGIPLDDTHPGERRHPGCPDTLHPHPAALVADHLAPCARCGSVTHRYGDTPATTICPTCQTKETHE